MSIETSLRDMNDAVLDLQSSDFNTYVRPLKRLAAVLKSDDLSQFTERLKEGVDFQAFVAAADPGGSMVGSASLNWPASIEEQLGLSIVLIERSAEDQDWMSNFAFQYYYGGRKHYDSIRKLIASAIFPFSRDFANFVEKNSELSVSVETGPKDHTKIFIVHGHDEAARDKVARFITKMGFEPVILHEQANRGMTIVEKLVANGNVGYAVVLLTPDDYGREKSESEERARARQNVILELGYFLGHIGRERVMALLKGDVEIPSDYMGVLYTPLDDGGGWRQELGRELQSAGYEIDWNKVMR